MEFDAYDVDDGAAAMLQRFVGLAEEARDLRCTSVPTLNAIPTPMSFYRGNKYSPSPFFQYLDCTQVHALQATV